MLPFGFFFFKSFFFFGRITPRSILGPRPEYQTLGPCSGRAESQPRHHQGSPRFTVFASFGPWGSAPTSVLNLAGDVASWIHRTAPPIGGPGRAVVSVCHSRPLSRCALCKSSSYMFCVCATLCLMVSDRSSSSPISWAASHLFIKFIALNCYYEM